MDATAPNRSDLDTLYDFLPIGVMALTSDRRVTIWNQQLVSWSGVPRSNIINRTLSEAFSDFDDTTLDQQLRPVFDGGAAVALSDQAQTVPLRLPDGRDRPHRTTVVPMQGLDGTRWALFAVEDVTDLTLQLQALLSSKEDSALAATRAEAAKRLAERRSEQLAELNRDLEEFTHLASHDLQEPLRTLTSFSTFLKSDLGENLPEAAARDLEHISAAAARMRRLIDGLLALSRVSRSEMSWSATSLPACVAEALELLGDRLHERSATILGADRLPTVSGDRRLLTQVFQNLLSNAITFADPSRPCTIDVSAERDGAGWLVKTKDNGIGVAQEYAAKIFAPFQRLHGVDQYPGSGMGLAICRRAIERHGGSVWAVPNDTVGTCFNFTLPDRQEQP